MEDEVLDKLWDSRHKYGRKFLDIIKGYEIKTFDNYPLSRFFIVDNTILFEHIVLRDLVYISVKMALKIRSSLDEPLYEDLLKSLFYDYLDIKCIHIFNYNSSCIIRWKDVIENKL